MAVNQTQRERDLHEALSIAWEALERATKPTGRFSMDHTQHAKNVIEDCAEDAKEALRRIGWHKPITQFFDGESLHAICSRCGKSGMIDSQGNLF